MEYVANNFFLLIFGIVLITYGIFIVGDALSYYANELAQSFGWSKGLMGFILIAAITSVPELVSVIFSASQTYYGLAAGGIFGSNSVNIAILSGIFLCFYRTKIYIEQDDLFAFLSSLILLAILGIVLLLYPVLNITPNRLVVFLVIFGIYALIMIHMKNLHKDEEQVYQEEVKFSLKILVCFILVSLMLIILAMILVKICERLTEVPIPFFNILLGENFVGTLFLALSTSIPELATSYQLVKNKNTAMAIGNISGSNVFNLMVLSGAALFGTHEFWVEIPMNHFFTIYTIIILSILMSIISLIKESQKTIVFINILIVLLWIGSLFFVF